MQSIMGALLTAGYAAVAARRSADSPNSSQVTNNVQSELTKSYDGAADIAKQYPQYSQQIVAGAKQLLRSRRPLGLRIRGHRSRARCDSRLLLLPQVQKEKSSLADYRRADSACGTQPAP